MSPLAEEVAAPQSAAAPMRIFVHLAHDKDAEQWKRAYMAGTLVGLNEETPYGYGRAARMGCEIVFSRSLPEAGLMTIVRLAIRTIAGFDYVHAYRQRIALRAADVVWTHTESQFLAVAAVLGVRGPRPKLLGQTVWLFDRWPRLSALHKALFRRLIKRVDVLTFHSRENFAVARALFPDQALTIVPYGIPAERVTPPGLRPIRPIRLLAPGSDRHRDWGTLVEAVRGRDDMELVILSGTADRALARGLPNVRIALARSNDELKAEFAAATLVCVPLLPNKHASGITVIQEAVLGGVPVIATDTGGLSLYFGPDHIRSVPCRDPVAWRKAILALADNPEAARDMASRAQARMREADIGAEAYVRRHVELSRMMAKH